MTARLPDGARERLAKICGRLGSDHDGERASAAALASRLLRDHGVTWAELVEGATAAAPGPVSPPRPRRRRASRRQAANDTSEIPEHVATAAWLLRYDDLLTKWEADFARGIASFRRLSHKQAATLNKIAARVDAYAEATHDYRAGQAHG